MVARDHVVETICAAITPPTRTGPTPASRRLTAWRFAAPSFLASQEHSAMPYRLLPCSIRATLLAGVIIASPPAASGQTTYGNDMLEPLTGQEGPKKPAKSPSGGLDGTDDLADQIGPLTGSEATGNGSKPAKSPSGSLDGMDDLADQIGPLTGNEATGKGSKPAKSPSGSLDGMDDLADQIGPLTGEGRTPPKKPRTKLPHDPLDIDVADVERELERQKAEQRRRDEKQKEDKKAGSTILIQRTYVDPCGEFTVSWGGTKKCQPMQRTRWELVSQENDADKAKNGDTPNRDDGRTPPDFGNDRGPAGPLGGAAPAPKAPGSPPPAPPPTPRATPAPGGSDGGAGRGTVASGSSTTADASGFATIGDFAVRVETATRMPNGDIDLLATFKTRTAVNKLIGNGDWHVYVTDADGVSTDTTALYAPGAGELKPFDRMPYVSAASPAQVRLRVAVPKSMAAIRSTTLVLMGGQSARFPIGPLGTSGALSAEPGSGAFSPLKRLDVRFDELKTAGATSELSFSVFNRTDRPQFAHGTYLTFTGVDPAGKQVANTGRVYSVRGAVADHYEGITVLPNETARFRIVFDAPSVRGPVKVSDGDVTATLAQPPAAEPIW